MDAHVSLLEGVVKRVGGKKKQAKGPIGVADQEEILDAVYAANEDVSRASKPDIQNVQRGLEDQLIKLLVLGVGAPVRYTVSELLCQLYERGDNIALYSCVGKLQDFLNGKESRNVSDSGRLSLLRCLSRLVDKFGTQLGSGFQESLTIAQKLYKSQSNLVREESLLMLASYVSVCTRDRFACQAQEASLKLAERASRDRVDNVRRSAARLIASIGYAGGQGLFTNGTAGFDEAVRICLRGMEDQSPSVRIAFSDALGDVSSCATSTSASEAIGKCKESKKPPLKQLLDNPSQTLTSVFLKTIIEGRKRGCICTVLALRKCFHAMKSVHLCNDEKLCRLVIDTLEVLNAASKCSPDMVPHAQACLVYFFHSCPLELLGNVSQIYLLENLIKLMEGHQLPRTPIAFQLVILQCSRLLIQKLGSVEEEQAAKLLRLFELLQLKSKVTIVLEQTALAISALLFAYPKISDSVTSKYLERLEAIRKDNKKELSDSEVLGYGFGLAAALSAVSKLELGIPETIIQRSYDFCSSVCCIQKSLGNVTRAGFTILISLLAIEDALDIPAKDFLKFFDVLKEDKAIVHKRWKSQKKAAGLVCEFQCHSSALQTLEAFTRQLLLKDEKGNVEIFNYLGQLLYQYLSLLVEAPIAGKPSEALSSAIQQLQLSLIQAFTTLPLGASTSKSRKAFLKLCSVSFQVGPNVFVPRSSLLRHLLNDMDSSLGPWHHGYDQLEDELQAFEGSLLSPKLSFDVNEIFRQKIVFHYALSIETVLVNSSIQLVQKIFCHLKWKEQKYFLELVIKAMKSCLNVGRSEKKRYHKDAIFTNSSCALLGILHSLSLGNSDSGSKDQDSTNLSSVVNLLLPCAKILLEEGISEISYVRASAEITAGACHFGGESLAKSLVKSLCQEQNLNTATSDSVRGLILWLGAIGRSLGGISLTGLLKSMVTKLQSIVSSGINETSQIWLLHSYWLIANASGPAFIPYVRQMLTIATQVNILSTSSHDGTSAILQTVARIGNSVVGVLGPEFMPGKFAFQRASLLIDGTKYNNNDYGAQLEQVLHIQQLLLFAPHVVSKTLSTTILDTLKSFIKTGQPGVRLAAATTLRHVAETTHPDALEGIEIDLIAALDLENDDLECKGLLKRVFCIVMEQGCVGDKASKWIRFCQNIILNENQEDGNKESEFLDDEDDENDGGGFGDEAEEDAAGQSRTGSCLETRAFVMECFCKVFEWVKSTGDDRHWNIIKSTRDSDKGDWLILQLQNLLNAGYKICTAGNLLRSLQPKGLHLLNLAVEAFGNEADPDYEGHPLMEQYQAQLLSALRSALQDVGQEEGETSPSTVIAGLELAGNLVEKGIIDRSGADGTLKRIVALMCKCLDTYCIGSSSSSSREEERRRLFTIISFSKVMTSKGVSAAFITSTLSEEQRRWLSKSIISLACDYVAKELVSSTLVYQSRFVGKKFFISKEFTKKEGISLVDAFLLMASEIKKEEEELISSFLKRELILFGVDGAKASAEAAANSLRAITSTLKLFASKCPLAAKDFVTKLPEILKQLLQKQVASSSNNSKSKSSGAAAGARKPVTMAKRRLKTEKLKINFAKF